MRRDRSRPKEPALADDQTPQQLADFDATQLAALVAGASDEDLAKGMANEANRGAVLDEIFRRMAEHVDPEKASGVAAVVHWKILDRPGGGEDLYEIVLKDGACEVSDSPGSEPRVTFIVKPVEFLKLVSGAVAGPQLFMSGGLKIEGDLMFAAQMASLFRIPQAG
jgi:putative sterol carrier protein